MKIFLEVMAFWLGSAAAATAILGAAAYFLRPFLRKLFWGSATPDDFPRHAAPTVRQPRPAVTRSGV